MTTRHAVVLGAVTLLVLSCAGEIRLVSTSAAASDGGAPLDGAAGEPRVCRGDGDCAGGLRCDVASRSCVACLVDAHCTADRPRCDAALHRCVECGVQSDCEPTERCQPETRRCAPICGDGGGCPSDTPICDADRGLCLECKVDGDCHEGERPKCDSVRGLCVSCRSNADCGQEEPLCNDEGRCVECRTSADCPASKPVCGPETFECSTP